MQGNVIEDPIQKMNNIMMKKTPYNLEQIFTQVCQYKVFVANLKRAVLSGSKEYLKNVCLINSEWFNKWKKISCYEAIKDELNMCDDITTNYKKIINEYVTILTNLQITESLDVNIDNNSINREYNQGEIEIVPESNFDIISPDLWKTFTNNSQNVNDGTTIEIKIDYITNDCFEIKLGKKSSYIIFWNLNEQRLGKLIFKFKDEVKKYYVFEDIKTMGINNYYACYLEDLTLTKCVKTPKYTFVCINKSEFLKFITKGKPTSSSNHKQGHNQNYINGYTNGYGLKPMGLENVFLTCYMNASLQSLVNVTKLSNFFTSNIFSEDNQILSAAFSRVVLNLLRMTPESQNMTYYSPKEFYEITCSISPIFQELAGDASDLINFFLEQIHNELNKYNVNENVFTKYFINNMGNNQKILALNNAINDYCQNNCSIISNLFYFLDKNKITCTNCNTITYNFQIQRILIFPLESIRAKKSEKMGSYQNSINIMDGFDHYSIPTPLTNENMFYCNVCKMQTNAWQNNALYTTPEYLIINLNRGKGKIYNIPVTLEENININNYVEAKLDNNKYKLISVITHFGQSGTSAHYIAFCFVEREGAWFKFNDTMVDRSNFTEASTTGDSYIVIYKRI